jgi:hypothetical protein
MKESLVSTIVMKFELGEKEEYDTNKQVEIEVKS